MHMHVAQGLLYGTCSCSSLYMPTTTVLHAPGRSCLAVCMLRVCYMPCGTVLRDVLQLYAAAGDEHGPATSVRAFSCKHAHVYRTTGVALGTGCLPMHAPAARSDLDDWTCTLTFPATAITVDLAVGAGSHAADRYQLQVDRRQLSALKTSSQAWQLILTRLLSNSSRFCQLAWPCWPGLRLV